MLLNQLDIPLDLPGANLTYNAVLWFDSTPYRTRRHSVDLSIETKVPKSVVNNPFITSWNIHTEQITTLAIDGSIVFVGQARIDVNVRGKFTHITVKPVVPEVVTMTIANNAISSSKGGLMNKSITTRKKRHRKYCQTWCR